MYRRPKFLEILLDIRRDMAHEADYDSDLFAEIIRTGRHSGKETNYSLTYDDENSNRGTAAPGTKKSDRKGASKRA